VLVSCSDAAIPPEKEGSNPVRAVPHAASATVVPKPRHLQNTRTSGFPTARRGSGGKVQQFSDDNVIAQFAIQFKQFAIQMPAVEYDAHLRRIGRTGKKCTFRDNLLFDMKIVLYQDNMLHGDDENPQDKPLLLVDEIRGGRTG